MIDTMVNLINFSKSHFGQHSSPYTCLPVSICSHTQELTPYKLLNMSLISLNFTHLTISFLVSQFRTLESSLCVSSSDYYLISPFGSSLIKVVLNPKIRTTECTHQTTVSTQNELMIDNNVDHVPTQSSIDSEQRNWTRVLSSNARPFRTTLCLNHESQFCT